MDLTKRTTEEVLNDHLKLREEKKLDEDLKQNYAEDIVLLTETKTYQGFNGVCKSAELLRQYVPGGLYQYKVKRVHNEIAYLVWSATSEKNMICFGADSYLIRNGKILIQTIFYHVHGK